MLIMFENYTQCWGSDQRRSGAPSPNSF